MYAVKSRYALQRWRRVEEEEKKVDTLLACRVQMRMQWRSACLLIWREAAGAEAVRDFPPQVFDVNNTSFSRRPRNRLEAPELNSIHHSPKSTIPPTDFYINTCWLQVYMFTCNFVHEFRIYDAASNVDPA